MGYWGLEKGFSTVYTYDEKDFKRIEGLEVSELSYIRDIGLDN